MDTDVIDNRAARRYELHSGGETAVLEYELDGGRITMIHTEVPATLGGSGVGSRLVRSALDDARDRGLHVVPLCPFVTAYIARHQDYLDLVDPADRTRIAHNDQA